MKTTDEIVRDHVSKVIDGFIQASFEETGGYEFACGYFGSALKDMLMELPKGRQLSFLVQLGADLESAKKVLDKS